MDGWGSLTMLIKRQNSEKYRKAKSRYDRQKKKEGFLTHDGEESEFDFPEVSEFELKRIKAKIKADHRRQRIKNSIISFVILMAVIAFLGWLIAVKTGAIKDFLQ
jgi:hypothetical protein